MKKETVICVPGARVWHDGIGFIFRVRLKLAGDLFHKYKEQPLIAVCGAAEPDEPVSEAEAGAGTRSTLSEYLSYTIREIPAICYSLLIYR